jgi:hypothetical protein
VKVLEVRNVHSALPAAIAHLFANGVYRNSRNGPVLTTPYPVCTVYIHPLERVIFWPERDANPFLHLYESLWMLAGRRDIAPLLRYTKQMNEYSDDGVTLHGAYGYRWRKFFAHDQLLKIAENLQNNPEDRRSVLQMWDTDADLWKPGKDVPCNLTATFQRDVDGRLDLTVFCRSNDIIWGAYGANAVHFSFLLEYMARKIECPVGVYRQISVNWHAYLETLRPLEIIGNRFGFHNPYALPSSGSALPTLLTGDMDDAIHTLLTHADTDFMLSRPIFKDECYNIFYQVLKAHHYWRTRSAPERYDLALSILTAHATHQRYDWIIAAGEWIERRFTAWEAKQRAGVE